MFENTTLLLVVILGILEVTEHSQYAFQRPMPTSFYGFTKLDVVCLHHHHHQVTFAKWARMAVWLTVPNRIPAYLVQHSNVPKYNPNGMNIEGTLEGKPL